MALSVREDNRENFLYSGRELVYLANNSFHKSIKVEKVKNRVHNRLNANVPNQQQLKTNTTENNFIAKLQFMNPKPHMMQSKS